MSSIDFIDLRLARSKIFNDLGEGLRNDGFYFLTLEEACTIIGYALTPGMRYLNKSNNFSKDSTDILSMRRFFDETPLNVKNHYELDKIGYFNQEDINKEVYIFSDKNTKLGQHLNLEEKFEFLKDLAHSILGDAFNINKEELENSLLRFNYYKPMFKEIKDEEHFDRSIITIIPNPDRHLYIKRKSDGTFINSCSGDNSNGFLILNGKILELVTFGTHKATQHYVDTKTEVITEDRMSVVFFAMPSTEIFRGVNIKRLFEKRYGTTFDPLSDGKIDWDSPTNVLNQNMKYS